MRPMPLVVPDHSGYLEALMLLSTLSGGLSHVYVSSLMVSCTHLVSTSLVSMVFPVYIMSIAYWRAQASSADHWHHLSRWCSQVSWYSVALLVLWTCPCSMALLPSLYSLYSIELLCIMGIAMVCAPASIWLTGDLQRAPGKLLGA